MNSNIYEESYSDFWLDNESLYQYIPSNSDEFSIDLINLAAYRRIVANFVFILTHKEISVQFYTDKKSKPSFTDGESIYLSATIRRKPDFDWTVGIALHEAAHILLTDFNVVKSSFSRIPIQVPFNLKSKLQTKGLSEEETAELCTWVWNYIEDRYIDSFVFKEAPGYRGYYRAMYDRLWNGDEIAKTLNSEKYRLPTLKSYKYRIINLTNPATDLDALVGLRKIAELIDILNILRLKTTINRVDLSYKVVDIILDYLPNVKKENSKELANKTIQTIHDKLSPEKINKEDKNKEKDKKKEDEEKGYEGESVSIEEFKKQEKFINHDFNEVKEKITEQQDAILDVIEKSNIVLSPAGFGMDGDFNNSSVDVVVVKKMTQFLIDAGIKTFPLSIKDSHNKPIRKYDDAVNRGFIIGRLLGKKIQIRSEENIMKYIRKNSGKIERRLLADIGNGSENIFSKTVTEKYNNIKLHISVDASTSMATDKKWLPTMTCVTAICVAASMVNNLDVSVSFRSTINMSTGASLPYVVLAYDSRVDKISKIRSLFPYLYASGATPEGLALEAISDEFIIGKMSNDKKHYFLNISDGEPSYNFNSRNNVSGLKFTYQGEQAAEHTKKQIEKMRANNVKILSYFIKGEDYSSLLYTDDKKRLTLKELFNIMYGRNAQFIDVESVMEIANTMNNLFLSRDITM